MRLELRAMANYVAALLCAGYGTRMGDLTAEVPKPLLPVAGKPVLDYLVDQLLELPDLDVIHVVSNAHYARHFEGWAASWSRRLPDDLELEVHDDGTRGDDERLGAVGDLDFLLQKIERSEGALPDGALVASGDNILLFSLRPLWDAFLASGESQVLALHEDDPEKLRRTGVLDLAGNRVLALHEKPENPPSRWACPSFYALDAGALARVAPYLDADGSADEIGRFLAHLVVLEPVHAVKTTGERLHVGSPEAYHHADEILRARPKMLEGL